MPEHRATNGTMTCALIELARLQAHQAWIEAKRRVQIFPRDVSLGEPGVTSTLRYSPKRSIETEAFVVALVPEIEVIHCETLHSSSNRCRTCRPPLQKRNRRLQSLQRR
jgi:hypothetical protein